MFEASPSHLAKVACTGIIADDPIFWFKTVGNGDGSWLDVVETINCMSVERRSVTSALGDCTPI